MGEEREKGGGRRIERTWVRKFIEDEKGDKERSKEEMELHVYIHVASTQFITEQMF